MVPATQDDSGASDVGKLGFTKGMVIQELGWDEDTDDDLRADIEEAGIAVLPGRAGSRYSSYWTMALGTPRRMR